MTVREYVENTIKECEGYFFRMALTNDEYDKVYHAKIEELPPMMDSGSDLLNDLISARLKGETNIASPLYTHQSMWDLELDTDTLKNISYQDGKARAVSNIADIQGWKDLSLRAQNCIYNED